KAAGAAERALIESGMAVLIVGGAFLGIGKDFISLAELLEFFFGCLVAGIFIRVILDGELAIGLFDFVRSGVFFEAEDLVIIALGHGGSGQVVLEAPHPGPLPIGWGEGDFATMTLAGRRSRSRSL